MEEVVGIQKEEEVQQVVVVDPKVDVDAALRVESAEDTDSDAHNMRQGGGREREGRPQQ